MNNQQPPIDWHVSLHFYNGPTLKTSSVDFRGEPASAVDVSAVQLAQPFPVSFDSFIAAINELAGGYAEGDGSFGVVADGGTWKIVGTIFEHFDAIMYAELMGRCPNAPFHQILQLLGAAPETVLVQQMQGGFFQSVEQFLNQN